MPCLTLTLESACAAAAARATFTPAINIYAGAAAPDAGYDGAETVIKYPCAIFSVVSAEPIAPRSLTRRCRLQVIVRSQRDDDSTATHRDRADDVLELVTGAQFAQRVNQYGALTLMLCVQRGEREQAAERHFETVIELDMDATPAAIA